MDNSNKPFCVILEEARAEYVRAFNEATAKTRLPAYLCEGILLGILADVRAQKAAEIVTATNAAPVTAPEEE